MGAIDTMLLVAVVCLGACVGSFLNVVVYRLPRGTFLSLGSRSVCPSCRRRIAWHDNVPVLGWLVLRGRARCCGARISPRYPLLEALTAAMFAALWLLPPSGLRFPQHGSDALLAFAIHATFVSLLIACTFIDVDFRILPDVLTKPGIALGVIGAVLLPATIPHADFLRPGMSAMTAALLASLAGAAAGFLLTLGIRIGARAAFRKEALGLGDVKLMACMGAFLGWQEVLIAFFLGCVLGAIGGAVHRWATGDAFIYFGPFLAAGGVILLFARGPILDFLLVQWPQWQASHPVPPAVLALVALVCLVLLVVLVRRGRGP